MCMLTAYMSRKKVHACAGAGAGLQAIMLQASHHLLPVWAPWWLLVGPWGPPPGLSFPAQLPPVPFLSL